MLETPNTKAQAWPMAAYGVPAMQVLHSLSPFGIHVRC